MKLAQAPHRILFFTGGLLALMALFEWSHTLLGRVFQPLPGVIHLMTMEHAFYMLYFFFAPFMFGFIFTAGPRWLSVKGPGTRVYVPLAVSQLAGGLLFLTGTSPSVGLALLDVAWLMACLQWWRLIWLSQAEDKKHALSIAFAFSFASAGALLGTWVWLTGSLQGWLFVAAIGMWGFLVPVFLTVSHRMVPFFTGAVLEGYQPWRPAGLLVIWWTGSLLMGLAEVSFWPLLRLTGALILLVSLGVTLYRWQPWRSLQEPLLAMLHLAFCWSVVATGLYGAGAVLDVAGVPHGLALSARHAMTLGFFLCMMMGFVTRVSLGHSGRPLRVDRLVWGLYLGLHGVAAGRVLALGPEALAVVSVMATLIVLGWLMCFLPVWWQARVDGQPG